jgi:hypothetical protein
MNIKNFNKFSANPSIYVMSICWYAFGLLTGYGIFRSTYHNAAKQKAEQVEMIKKEVDWSSVENINFDLDMKTMGVTLVKRTFDEQGEEATLIECGSSNQRYFICSRDIHEKLVKEFQELLEARKAETP